MATETGLGVVPFFFVELDPQWAGICNGMAVGSILKYADVAAKEPKFIAPICTNQPEQFLQSQILRMKRNDLIVDMCILKSLSLI
ncbi:hypothetical protein LWI28_003288 [Acer negundo]|uniref:Uncharacterized protein n=1 Tax=Acer negundo TaxID=4023 RepID=A0AAD5NSX2_ACENE|nr:hypothetical protein LWI28_003288 [Acer negundo]